MECNLPNIRRACCDMSQLGPSCGSDQTCMQNGMAAFPPAELQWFQANAGPSACPGMAAIQADPASMMAHCTMNGQPIPSGPPPGSEHVFRSPFACVRPNRLGCDKRLSHGHGRGCGMQLAKHPWGLLRHESTWPKLRE